MSRLMRMYTLFYCFKLKALHISTFFHGTLCEYIFENKFVISDS